MIKVGLLAGSSHYYQRDTSAGAYYGAADQGIATGGAAAAAGLTDFVTASQLENLLMGRSADGSRELLRVHKNRKEGCEFHAAPDKSVSVLFATSPPEIAKGIAFASEAALRTTLREAEATCGITRRGKAGRKHESGKLVFVIYTHTTSRAGEPQLHHHVAIPNLVLRADGTWGAHHNRPLYKAQRKLTETYNKALCDNLVALGIHARVVDGRCVIGGVPRELCEVFSTRRKEVEKAKQHFYEKDKHAAQRAAWATRRKKDNTPEAERREHWREVAKAHGYTPSISYDRVPTAAELDAVRKAAEAAYPTPGRQPSVPSTVPNTQREVKNTPRPVASAPTKQAGQAIGTQKPVVAPDQRSGPLHPVGQPVRVTQPSRENRPTQLAPAVEPAAKRRAPLRRSPDRLARHAVKLAVAELAATFAYYGLDQIEERAQARLKEWERRGVGVEKELAPALGNTLLALRGRPQDFGLIALPNGVGYVTTRQWRLENGLAADLVALASRPAKQGPPPSKVLKHLRGPNLTPEQKAAVSSVVASPTRLAVLDGTGRSGKTSVAGEVCKAFERAGRKVYAVGGTALGADALVAGTVTPPLSVYHFNQLSRRRGVIETWKQVYQAIKGKQFGSLDQLARYAEAAHRGIQGPPIVLGRRSVLVIDDAHRVPTADLATAVRRARKAGAKVVLVGDSQGPLPARPGGAFAWAARTSPTVKLSPTQDVADQACREAIRQLAASNGPKTVLTLENGGVLKSADRPRTQLLSEYRRGGFLERPERTVVLTATEQEAHAVNRSVQRCRLAAGHLRHPTKGDGCTVWVGDRVEITRADYPRGIPAHSLGTLAASGLGRQTVKLDCGKYVTVATKESVLKLAYALGPTAAAGHTFDQAFVLLAQADVTSRYQRACPTATRFSACCRAYPGRQLLSHGLATSRRCASRTP